MASKPTLAYADIFMAKKIDKKNIELAGIYSNNGVFPMKMLNRFFR